MNVLKQIILFILCLQLTFPSVVGNLVRMPNLIVHYIHHNYNHNHNHKKVSFIDFIANHYGNTHSNKNEDKDDKEHKKLPFNDDYSAAKFQQIVAIKFQQNEYSFVKQQYKKTEPLKTAFVKSCFYSKVAISIWHPPQLS